MDKTIKCRSGQAGASSPVIVLANWYQFGSGERADRPRVESRMLLWCHAGRGRLRINGHDAEFSPGDWVLLPWRHHLVYQADSDNPFLVGGIHIIPSHDDRTPVKFQVAHRAGDPIANHPARRDARWQHLDGTVRRTFNAGGDPLQLLAHYIVESYQRSAPARSLMTRLAALLVDELTQAVQRGPSDPRPPSILLRRMQVYAQAHLDRALSIEELAASAGCSEATAYRSFRQHAHTSPGRWISRLRAERAALLLRTTTLPVREIGRRIGLTDPFHFSRQFKRQMGASPRAYRDGKLML